MTVANSAALSASQVFNAVGSAATTVTAAFTAIGDCANMLTAKSGAMLEKVQFQINEERPNMRDQVRKEVAMTIARRNVQIESELARDPKLAAAFEAALKALQAAEAARNQTSP